MKKAIRVFFFDMIFWLGLILAGLAIGYTIAKHLTPEILTNTLECYCCPVCPGEY